jgi:hypothetical protein
MLKPINPPASGTRAVFLRCRWHCGVGSEFLFSSVHQALFASVIVTLLPRLIGGYISDMFAIARPFRKTSQTGLISQLAATAALVTE